MITRRTLGGVFLSLGVIYLFLLFKQFNKKWLEKSKTEKIKTLTYFKDIFIFLILAIVGAAGLFLFYFFMTPLCY